MNTKVEVKKRKNNKNEILERKVLTAMIRCHAISTDFTCWSVIVQLRAYYERKEKVTAKNSGWFWIYVFGIGITRSAIFSICMHLYVYACVSDLIHSLFRAIHITIRVACNLLDRKTHAHTFSRLLWIFVYCCVSSF